MKQESDKTTVVRFPAPSIGCLIGSNKAFCCAATTLKNKHKHLKRNIFHLHRNTTTAWAAGSLLKMWRKRVRLHKNHKKTSINTSAFKAIHTYLHALRSPREGEPLLLLQSDARWSSDSPLRINTSLSLLNLGLIYKKHF